MLHVLVVFKVHELNDSVLTKYCIKKGITIQR